MSGAVCPRLPCSRWPRRLLSLRLTACAVALAACRQVRMRGWKTKAIICDTAGQDAASRGAGIHSPAVAICVA